MKILRTQALTKKEDFTMTRNWLTKFIPALVKSLRRKDNLRILLLDIHTESEIKPYLPP